MKKEDLKQDMTQNAIAVGTIVHEISSIQEAVQYAVDLTEKQHLKTMACPGLDNEAGDMLSELCKSHDLKLLDSPLRENAHNLDVSLTLTEYGIAETGSLMVASDSEEMRIATMLAQIHVAVLPVSKIRPNAKAIESNLDTILKTDTPSYTAFITGPSRTADIERVLAIGVHGPVELHLLLMEETKP
ncbi:MAG: lactate utilization protein [Thermodesulfobacteriota bacterium]